jgi:hypothetical protein
MSFRLRSLAYLIGGLMLLQAADFVFTYLLLDGGVRGDIYESNPLARSILDRGGWLGLAAFKLSITAVVLSAVAVVARRRRVAAIRLLVVLCLLMLGVNVYSGTLLAAPDQEKVSEQKALAVEADLGSRMGACAEFIRERDQVCDEMLAGRRDLNAAIQDMTDLVVHFAPRTRMPPAARMPNPQRRDEIALYLDFHLRHRASDRGLDAPGLQGMSQELIAYGAQAMVHAHDSIEPLWLRAPRVVN